MRAIDIIVKKRDGLELNKAEIEFFINGYTQGDIPDYQASAWAMAVLLRGDDGGGDYEPDPGDGCHRRHVGPFLYC